MPPLSVLIKPASSACNMSCSYCFYRDEAQNRKEAFMGMLSPENAEKVVKGAMEFAEGSCSFMFQGGEPALAGIDFFRSFIELEKKYSAKGIRISNSIQTNGLLIDGEWASFFRENDFLVGVSLDGNADLHNLNRYSPSGDETFNRVMKSVSLLRKEKVDFNILSVVTSKNARSAEKIYNFFRKQDLRYLQFIPCLDPFGEKGMSPSADEYASFLIRIFDLWYDDLLKGRYVSIRHIENWLLLLSGRNPASCAACGKCGIQFVVEGDGGVYPCDFYVLDRYRLGTVGEDDFTSLATCETARRFIGESLTIPDECRVCPFYPLCRNGCRRERKEDTGVNRYCESYKEFFSQRLDKLQNAANMICR